MEIEDILVNPDNHAKLSQECEYSWGHQWEKQLKAHTSVIDFLYANLSDRHDWGGRYHLWLKQFGIEPEADGGWWSKAAVDPRNIQRFINEYQEDLEGNTPINTAHDRAREIIQAISSAGRFRANSLLVEDVVNALIGDRMQIELDEQALERLSRFKEARRAWYANKKDLDLKSIMHGTGYDVALTILALVQEQERENV